MNSHQPAYFAIIPANVRYDTRIRPSAKLLYGEITALTNDKGYCWAKNDYFAKLYGVAKETVSRWISNLEEFNYIKTTVILNDKKEVAERRIYIQESHTLGVLTKTSRGIDENVKGGIDENVKDNNTLLNNTSNINNNMRKSVHSVKNDFEEVWKEYPNKKGKSKAFSAYQKAIADGVSHDIILQGVKSYAKDCKNKRTKPEYIAHGSTWFGQRRWEDEYYTKEKQFKFSKNNKQQKSAPSSEDLLAYQELMREGGFNV